MEDLLLWRSILKEPGIGNVIWIRGVKEEILRSGMRDMMMMVPPFPRMNVNERRTRLFDGS